MTLPTVDHSSLLNSLESKIEDLRTPGDMNSAEFNKTMAQAAA